MNLTSRQRARRSRRGSGKLALRDSRSRDGHKRASFFNSHFISFLTSGMIYLPCLKGKPLIDEKMAHRAAKFAQKFLGVLIVCLIGTHVAFGQYQPPETPRTQTTTVP